MSKTLNMKAKFSLIFTFGLIITLTGCLERSKEELSMAIKTKSTEYCEKWDSPNDIDIEKPLNQTIKQSGKHFSNQDIFLIACKEAMSKDANNDTFKTKVALVNVEQGKLESAESIFATIKEPDNRYELIIHLVDKGHSSRAEKLLSTLEDKVQRVTLSDKLGKRYIKKNQPSKAEGLYKSLHSEGFYVGFFGLQQVYDSQKEYRKSLNILLPLLEWQTNKNKDASQTFSKIAKYYDEELGVEKDLYKARDYYLKGVKHLGQLEKNRLASMLYNGVGGPAEKEKAIELGYRTDEMKVTEASRFPIKYLDPSDGDFKTSWSDKAKLIMFDLFKRNTGALSLCSSVKDEEIGIIESFTSDPHNTGVEWQTHIASINYSCYSSRLGDQNLTWVFTATCDSRSNDCTCVKGKGAEYTSSVISSLEFCVNKEISL